MVSDPGFVGSHAGKAVRLSAPARSDIEWWHQFCGTWNGTSVMFEVNKGKPGCDVAIVSDGSAGQGWARLVNSTSW